MPDEKKPPNDAAEAPEKLLSAAETMEALQRMCDHDDAVLRELGTDEDGDICDEARALVARARRTDAGEAPTTDAEDVWLSLMETWSHQPKPGVPVEEKRRSLRIRLFEAGYDAEFLERRAREIGEAVLATVKEKAEERAEAARERRRRRAKGTA